MQSNNSKLNTFLLIILVILAGVLVFRPYFQTEKVAYTPTPMPEVVSHNTTSSQNNSNTPPAPTSNPTQFNWNASLAEITAMIKKDFSGGANPNPPVSILRSDFDITGDGVNEALVFNGNSGAYVTEVAVMRIENGKIVSAKWKTKNGQVGLVSLAGGASVMNQLEYGIIPGKGFYQARVERDGNTGGVATCEVEAYQWNSTTKIFDYSSSSSTQYKQSYCAQIGN